ncbi:MAG: hypothetical protein QXQ31_07635 [Zestosphaera sp.]
MAAQKVRRASVAPDVKDLLDESDAAGLLAWGRIDSIPVPGFLLEGLLLNYVLELVGSRFGRVLCVDTHAGDPARPAIHPESFVFYFAKPDAGGATCLDVRSDSKEVVGVVRVVPPSFRVVKVYVNTDVVSPEEFVELVRSVSSAVYSAVMALLDSLPNSPMCARDRHCLDYVKELWGVLKSTFDRVGLYPPVDPEVYERVKDVVERGAVPFRSNVVVGEEDFRELEVGFHRLFNSSEEEGVFLFTPDTKELKVDLGGGLTATVLTTTDFSKSAWYYLCVSLNRIYVWVEVDRSGTDRYHLSVHALVEYPPPRAEEAVELLGNWFEYVRRALEALAEWSKSGGLPPRTAEALASYLRAWTAVLEKYRSELEKNKAVV